MKKRTSLQRMRSLRNPGFGRHLVLSAIVVGAALALAGIAAASARPDASSGTNAGARVDTHDVQITNPAAFDSSNFGYHVDLPQGWRNSSRLPRFIDGAYKRGHDVFTLRTDADEASGLASHWLGPAWQGVVLIEIYRNTAGLTPMAWATRPEWDWRQGQSVRAVSFAGRQAVLISGGPRFAEAYYVANGTDMFVVGFIQGPDQPAKVKATDLQSIVRSFRFTR